MRVLLFCLLILSAGPFAYAHEAPVSVAMPLGWTYDYGCCSDKDCAPIATKDVTAGKGGYVMPSGETVPYGSHKIKRSRDENFHWCTAGGKGERTYCLYVPDMGF